MYVCERYLQFAAEGLYSPGTSYCSALRGRIIVFLVVGRRGQWSCLCPRSQQCRAAWKCLGSSCIKVRILRNI